MPAGVGSVLDDDPVIDRRVVGGTLRAYPESLLRAMHRSTSFYKTIL